MPTVRVYRYDMQTTTAMNITSTTLSLLAWKSDPDHFLSATRHRPKLLAFSYKTWKMRWTKSEHKHSERTKPTDYMIENMLIKRFYASLLSVLNGNFIVLFISLIVKFTRALVVSSPYKTLLMSAGLPVSRFFVIVIFYPWFLANGIGSYQ